MRAGQLVVQLVVQVHEIRLVQVQGGGGMVQSGKAMESIHYIHVYVKSTQISGEYNPKNLQQQKN